MSLRAFAIVFCSLLVVACTWGGSGSGEEQSSSASSIDEKSDVVVISPKRGRRVTSPLTVNAKARGNWFFEGQIPVQLVDEEGNVIATAIGQVDGGWMTMELVKFTATLTFETTANRGYVVIKKDNPSGLPENEGEYRVLVRL